MHRLELKLPPVAVFLLTGLGMWALAKQVPGADMAVPAAGVFTIILVLIGGALAISAILQFRRHDTTIHPGNPDKTAAIVTTGIYRYTRNPMYLGLACALGAWAITLGNVLALLGLPVFVAYMNRFQITPEERALQAGFGDDYRTYKRNVRRWL